MRSDEPKLSVPDEKDGPCRVWRRPLGRLLPRRRQHDPAAEGLQGLVVVPGAAVSANRRSGAGMGMAGGYPLWG